MDVNDRILVTGARGMVGGALCQYLKDMGHQDVIGIGREDCDLMNFSKTCKFFSDLKPDYVFHVAARVYGIMGNMNNKGKSYLENILINTHTVEASRLSGVKKFLAMGSGCVYPNISDRLLQEDQIFDGQPHPSEDSYAHAKRAMLVQLNAYKEQYDFQSAFAISGNLYGPNDKFDEHEGHVIPALVKKFFDAQSKNEPVTIWGNGSAQRDFSFIDDTSAALYLIMKNLTGPVNMGSGNINAIRDIVEALVNITRYSNIQWDETKPNGQPFRAYDLTRLKSTGFTPRYSLPEGLKKTYAWYCANNETARM